MVVKESCWPTRAVKLQDLVNRKDPKGLKKVYGPVLFSDSTQINILSCWKFFFRIVLNNESPVDNIIQSILAKPVIPELSFDYILVDSIK